ncbi:hypothetical protein TRIUR3_25807 [Triticum urartu]|uniref:RING-type domain-containing protein n=1 Tax=Triticum urartu TaxID=4572 RepID=M7Z1X8_TRIUA|nr:altered inheritance of mitochondria protein 3-like [Triticum urartu]XP_048529103.1 altered inheritance of mitochondria protein 3-like [Triticum urartu]EMS46375.1 hypothetical protein TRIUR3_25807 [Triticum urartu]
MGFDNECILNIQTLPGEYFCPVCRTLIYPNEALQAQCTHLYCKPCLAYVAATTQACPYDGYLVTEADSKPLVDSNKSLAETIGKVTVQCLYNKSGCQWQGNLSECNTHGTACAYGNSPVVCNRCGTQIVHRQVQEHAQLCPGVQPQTQQADGSLTQSSAATTQAVTQDPSAVSSVAPVAAPTAGAVTTSALATGSAGVTTTSTVAVAPFAGAPTYATQGQAVAPQIQTAEQYQQQLQYHQYYQQHYPGYNPYTQQYQQYGQYQQYTQPQTQVAPQNVAQVPAQPAPYAQPQFLQPPQPQHIVPNQSQNPQLQAPAVQPQPQQNPPLHSAPQIPQMQPQGDVQPIAHTQVCNQPFAMPATQAIASQVQPYVQPHPPHQQQAVAQQQPQMQYPPQQQHPQSQMQHQHPQVRQQSYPQPHVYHQPHPVAQSQNPSVHAVAGHQSYSQPQPAHQMAHGAAIQHPVHASHQQLVGPQHPALVHPPQGQFPLQGQQPSMLAPQGTQHTPQHQQHGHQAQRPPMHPSIPSQAPPQGFPLNTPVPSQTSQSYQQGMHSSQQQIHPQPFQPHGPQYMQQQHVPTSTSRSTSYVATPHQFQESGKSESAANASGNAEVGDNTNGGSEYSGIKPEYLGDKNVNGEQNDFSNIRKNAVQTGIALGVADGLDKGKGKDESGGQESNSQSEASNISNDLEKGGSLQQASQKSQGALGSYAPPGMGRQRPSGPDTMLTQHMLHPPVPCTQAQKNQMRPPSHSFPENVRPTVQQQLYGVYQSEMAPRVFAPNLPRPAPTIPDDGMIRPPMAGPLPGLHDTTMPPFAPENVGRPHPVGMRNGVGGEQLGNSRAFHEEGFNTSREHFRSLGPPYPGRYNVNPKDIEENMKQFPGPTHLDDDSFQRGPRPFDGFDSLPGRPPFPNKPGPYPIGFPEDLSRKPHSIVGHPDFVSPGEEFGHHRVDGMPRNPGSFVQGMTAGPGGLRKDQLGPGNLPGSRQHDFDNLGFPHTHFHPADIFLPRNLHGSEPLGHGQLHGIEPSGHRFQGHVHPDDPNFDDYSRHGFPQESGRFSSGGFFSSGEVGWCRICMFNCGSAEDLGLHVHTREHQQHAMDIVLKMKHDVAKRQKMNPGGPKSLNKKVAMKGNFHGNRR